MALLFMDGFGGADGSFKWDVTSDNLTAVTGATARIPGGYAGGGSTISMYKTIPASTKVFVVIGIMTQSDPAIVFYGDSGVTLHIVVIRNQTTGFLEIRRGSTSGTLLGTGTQPIAVNQWNYIEVSATISDTVGEVHDDR